MKRIMGEENLSKQTMINLLIIILLVSGIFGFLYEEIFYFIDLGYLVKRGSTYGPWIPIYAFGGLIVTLLAYRYHEKPLFILILSILTTTIIEYATGYILDHYFHTRLWDYNQEIWNYGNINGYICLRSITFFGISCLFLIYGIIPFILKWIKKQNEKNLTILCYTGLTLFLLDILLYHLL